MNLIVLIHPIQSLTGYCVGNAKNCKDLSIQIKEQNLLDQISSIAIKYKTHIVIGYPEFIGEEEILSYNTVSCFSPSGDMIASYRKTHLFQDDEKSMFKPGNSFDFPSIPITCLINGIRVGFLICYDCEFPECARHLALNHKVECIIAPTASGLQYRRISEVMIPTRAWENTIYFAYLNYIGTSDDINFGGCSVVCDLTGTAIQEQISCPIEKHEAFMCTISPNDPKFETFKKNNSYLKDLRKINFTQ